MDRTGARIPLTTFVDLHLHSTASDGILPPSEVVARAARAGLTAMALTDHDTLDGLDEAIAAGTRLGVRVVGGCEFSVRVGWGEMHLLGYFLLPGSGPVTALLEHARADRLRRGADIVEGLQAWGIDIQLADVLREADGAPVGRPHVARALVRLLKVPTLDDAFRQWLGRGRPAFVEKQLPALADVSAAVHEAGGLVSAAHLRERATTAGLERLKADGLDAVEVRHPGHHPEMTARIADAARRLGLLPTGGSDWHGDDGGVADHATIGSQAVPTSWLDALEERRDRLPVNRPAV